MVYLKNRSLNLQRLSDSCLVIDSVEDVLKLRQEVSTENNSIEVKCLSKDFHIGFSKTSFIKGIAGRIIEKDTAQQPLHALRRINFSVKRGEAFCILGPNGSGKTTLLKIIAGILTATSGEVKTYGRLVAFLQLGLGFQDELTALDNIYLYAAFLGMDKNKVNSRLDEIVKFSELGDFLNMRLKYFSSGMRSRLAFSVIVQSDADIILLDEFLAVGDIHFQQRCFNVLEGFKQQGRTLLVVSQSLDVIKRFCQRAILLDRGSQIFQGDIATAIERYRALCK